MANTAIAHHALSGVFEKVMDALIIIDMQEGPFSQSDKYDSEGVISRINQLSEYIRENDGRVIFIQHDGPAEDQLLPLTPGWEILRSLTQNDSDIVVRKTTNDSFYKTELSKHLKALNAEQLIISGWATDLCVDSTIRSAVSLGHNVVVASDCHTVSNRPNLSAEQVIEHHNWLWENLLTSGNLIEVKPLASLCN